MLSLNHSFTKFIFAGGFAALVNFFSRIVLSNYLNYISAIIVAYIIGMITAYAICRLWVFQAKENSSLQQIAYFTLVNIFAILQTLFVSLFFAHYIFINIMDMELRETLAHFIGIIVPVFTSYLGHKYVTFR
jgi:putative flippase GtrA